MKITIGKIKKRKSLNPAQKIRAQVNSMKLGEYFEITGSLDQRKIHNIRSVISYFSKSLLK